jgi:hypothetical protein
MNLESGSSASSSNPQSGRATRGAIAVQVSFDIPRSTQDPCIPLLISLISNCEALSVRYRTNHARRPVIHAGKESRSVTNLDQNVAIAKG